MSHEQPYDSNSDYVMMIPDGYLIRIGEYVVHVQAPEDIPGHVLAEALSRAAEALTQEPAVVERNRMESRRLMACLERFEQSQPQPESRLLPPPD